MLDDSKLSFRISTGGLPYLSKDFCTASPYVVVEWRSGSSSWISPSDRKKRRLVSCHRTAKAARAAAKKQRAANKETRSALGKLRGALYADKWAGGKRIAIYNLKTGKKLK